MCTIMGIGFGLDTSLLLMVEPVSRPTLEGGTNLVLCVDADRVLSKQEAGFGGVCMR